MGNKQAGFTVIEMLIVLTIILMITTFSMNQMVKSTTNDPLEDFLEQLEKDIFMMQQQAMTKQKQLSLLFHLNEHYYMIYDSPLNPAILKRDYDHRLQLDLTSINNPLHYRSSGVPINPGSFILTYNEKHYKVTFPFGKGRFYVTEL
ncbi:competence type IV pilus minor pilin ComGD [Tenuibacillus multivorans]|uniref:Competence protein ComGD n=1 Tax=Tenuibacillus multivorans TaxID=237069 RepID=A0A1G9Z960_9BACI|nr:competence type IV pilus minor pilin ComGD [Tenuibacillus multivorans]GEL77342.1 hypothetical protein TMU01_15770 [Tenuibacillus multivorans]SDN17982.1 competence protein ComGD [Tenuibacillus multivorans]